MSELFNLDKYDDGTIKLWSDLRVAELYRFNYDTLKNSNSSELPVKNAFIVYILYEKCHDNRDVIYVGKSKNGLKNRPTAHEDISQNWKYCYVLTESGSLLNDGSIHYIEDRITEKARATNRFTVTTNQTTKDTINSRDKRRIDPLFDALVEMLEILGVDLITTEMKKAVTGITAKPDNTTDDGNADDPLKCHVTLKHRRVDTRHAEGIYDFGSKRFTLLKGSELCPLADYSEKYRGSSYQKYCKYIDEGKISKEGIVLQDLEFGGPSIPTFWYGGGDGDCYHDCIADDGRTLFQVREDLGLGLTPNTTDDGTTSFHVTLTGRGFEKVRHAEGTYDFATNKFILYAGAELCPPELYNDSYIGSNGKNGGKPSGSYNQYKKAVENGDIRDNVTVKDLEFNGVSAPCCWYLGRPDNGYTSCIADDGRTLFQIRESMGISAITRNRG